MCHWVFGSPPFQMIGLHLFLSGLPGRLGPHGVVRPLSLINTHQNVHLFLSLFLLYDRLQSKKNSNGATLIPRDEPHLLQPLLLLTSFFFFSLLSLSPQFALGLGHHAGLVLLQKGGSLLNVFCLPLFFLEPISHHSEL